MKTLRRYQQEAVSLGATRNILLADECGLGKTLSAVYIAMATRKHPDYWRALVVCPLRVRPQWIEEIRDVSDDTLITTLEAKGTQPPLLMDWVIVHYEILARLAPSLSQVVWDVVIADEAHRLKNRKTQWTRAINRIVAGRKVALTGTPMERSVADLWSPGHWLYPDIFTSYWKFFEHYVNYIDGYFGRKIIGTKNEEQLATLLELFMLRRTKQQVAKELPPRIIQKVGVEMDDVQRAAYDTVHHLDDALVQLGTEQLVITNVLTLIVRLQQISSHPPILGITAKSAKIDWVLGWLEDNPETPVVIFSKFRAVVEELDRRIVEPHSVIMGGVREPERKGRIVIGTIAGMGEGLNLQWAEVGIFVDQEWSTIKMNQAYDRIHRLGITSPRLIYLLYSSKSIDEHVLKTLEHKWTEQEMVYQLLAQNK